MILFENSRSTCMIYNGQKVRPVPVGNLVKSFPDMYVTCDVTYHVKEGDSFTVTYDLGKDILHPTGHSIALSGYTFVGWRYDNIPDSDVLSYARADAGTIDLYAVFSRPITLYTRDFYGMHDDTEDFIYNNGRQKNAEFRLDLPSWNGWNPYGWSSSLTSFDLTYQPHTYIYLDESTTIYGIYNKTITITLFDNRVPTDMYLDYFSLSGLASKADKIQLPWTEQEGFTSVGWTLSPNGYGEIVVPYDEPFDYASLGVEYDVRLYSIRQGMFTVSFNKNSGSGTMSPVSVLYNLHGLVGVLSASYIAPSCKFTRSGYTFNYWDLNGEHYKAKATILLDSDITLKAIWKKNT